MDDRPRLIEFAFPIKQASLDSVHEKNVRHGHISTLHIWPARRPLAACRAALIATLLPDPGTPEERQKLVEKIGGRVVQTTKKKQTPGGRVEEVVKEETEGGVLHWKREQSSDMDWFREEIRQAYGGRAPKVLDPFAGGGAIPLEAMRLGCEATAIDINPVAWFILKCTLEYPQKLAGQTRPLPEFALQSPEFMESYLKGTGKMTRKQLEERLANLRLDIAEVPPADLAWHVRAWGWWVLQRAKEDLERFYPVVDGKPTVAYLWARTVTCKNCRATIPLLKTRWLCKKDNKRVRLTMEPNEEKTGVVFGVHNDVARVGNNNAARREDDKRVGAGTMSRSGATCPCCGTIMEMSDIRIEGQQGRLGTTVTAVVVDGPHGKEYREATLVEAQASQAADQAADEALDLLPSVNLEAAVSPASTRSISCHLYGVRRYRDLFTSRQVLALATLAKWIHRTQEDLVERGYGIDWVDAIQAYLALSFDRLVAFNCVNVRWKTDAEAVVDAFARFSMSLLWDFAESQPIGDAAGAWVLCYNRIATALDTYAAARAENWAEGHVAMASAAESVPGEAVDVVMTDPPYYEAISYADLSDFFYVWLRGVYPRTPNEFAAPLSNKDEEIVQHIREDKDREAEREKYEAGLERAFSKSRDAMSPSGRFVCVFAHKDPSAWETAVAAMVKAGLVVTAAWPIQTEMLSRQRATNAASLSSSLWLVCRKRLDSARPGWDTKVLEEMRKGISERLREFWDAGIRGPDFVWAATGPALEAYSKHPVVKKANQPDQLMTVSEFLRHVRRIVVDFVVGRVLSGNGEGEAITGLDDVTTYYLLHRHDFGTADAPAGACILYAVSCNLSDGDLADQHDILLRTGGSSSTAAADEDSEESEDEDAEPVEGSGSTMKLKSWNQRKRKSMGYGSAAEMALRKPEPTTEVLFPDLAKPEKPTRMVPLIDRVHRLMHLWKEGDVVKVDEYLEASGMRHEGVFPHLLQALIELAPAGSEERSILESISNHAASRGIRADRAQAKLPGQQAPTNGGTEE